MKSTSWFELLPKLMQQRLLGRTVLLSVLQNSSWLLIDKIFRLGLGLLVGAWVARYLGPDQYGALAYILAYIAFFQAVATLGLDGIVVRDISQNIHQASSLLGSTFALRLFVGCICWLLAIGGMAAINGPQDQSVVLTALAGSSLVFQAADTVDLWFQSQSQVRRTVLAKLIAYLISNGIKIFLIISSAPLVAFAVVITLEAMTVTIGLFVAYKRFPCSQRWRYTNMATRQLLKECWPLIMSALSIIVYMRIDQIMIKEMLGNQELGIYTAILPLATLWQFIPMMLNTSLAPFIAQKKAESEMAYWQTLQNIFNAYAILGWLVCIPIAILSSLIVDTLYGVQYHDSAIVLTIYVFTNVFINMGVAQGLWLLNERKAIFSLYKAIVGAMIAILGNWFVIPKFGVAGVAVIAVLAQFVSAVLMNLLVSKKLFYMQLRSLFFLSFKY